MKLSKKAYYGLRASLALAKAKTPLSSHVIAEEEGISPTYLEKILQALRKHNVVEAARGTKGGYILTGPHVSAWDVISALEGPLTIYPAHTASRNVAGRPSLIKGTLPCMVPTHCQTNAIFRELEENLESTLKNIALTSLINQS